MCCLEVFVFYKKPDFCIPFMTVIFPYAELTIKVFDDSLFSGSGKFPDTYDSAYQPGSLDHMSHHQSCNYYL